VHIALIPRRLAQLAGPVADVFPVHLLQCLCHVQAIQETHKAKALGLLGALVLHNLHSKHVQHARNEVALQAGTYRTFGYPTSARDLHTLQHETYQEKSRKESILQKAHAKLS